MTLFRANRVTRAFLLCFFLSVAFCCKHQRLIAAETPGSDTQSGELQANTTQFVVPIAETLFRPQPTDVASEELIQAYANSIGEWGKNVRKRVKPVPEHPDWKYIGLKRHVENDVRPTAYSAMVLSFLSECQPSKPMFDAKEQAAMRDEAIGLLRYLTTSHVSGGGTCLNGKAWGNQWQSALWSRVVCMAAWQIWPHLEDDLQQAVVRMIEFEADRFVEATPKSSVVNDTGAEENAWNASITSLACNMMPKHPRAGDWETAAKKYMYNTFSVKADAQDETLGDDGKRINQWVTTVNAHDDFTVENHRLVHVGYLKNSAAILEENAVHWVLAGKQPPLACQHHMPEVFQVLLSCMNWNGAPIYFGGNDWRIYESQCTDVVIFCMLNRLTRDPSAAYLEQVAVERLRERQIAEGGFYNARRDLEYGGLCATRLIACFFAHAAATLPTANQKAPSSDGVNLAKSSPTALSAEEYNEKTRGVKHLKSARTVLHRTPTKFASFTWAQKRMALAIPSEESSVVWPHFASYLGLIDRKDSSYRHAKLSHLEVLTDEQGFEVSGTLLRASGKLEHDFFYASPAEDYTIYVERLRPKAGFQIKSRQSGVIGLEYAISNNHRTLRGEFGELTTQGKSGPKTTHGLFSRWLNIDDRIGYVVLRSDGRPNLMRYHDRNVVAGRKPHLQEWISLLGEKVPGLSQESNWACVVTFLNQNAKQTASLSEQIRFQTENDAAVCQIGEKSYHVDFARLTSDSSK